MSVPPEAVPPGPPAAAGGTDDKNLAMITHLSGILLGFILPLIIWLMNKDNPAKGYLTEESKEALNFQITVLIGYVACMILTVILIGAFLLPFVWLFNLIFCIIAAVAVNSKGSYRYPIALRLIK
ncbi:MAG TPA: DUF4870 domain-containing protein [Rhodanobacteraceae bacterium]|jgi:uncharacterized Tic20 family protein|nr:DUF4870 domain-containing protein [Rhodanobacteraceae bacterium]